MAQHKTAIKSGGKGRGSKRSAKKNEASRSARGGTSVRDAEVAIDRRRDDDRRDEEQEPEERSQGAAPQMERRKKVNRRRQIDPTTCERDYTDDEVEFMNALDDYKRKSGRMFPTCSEVLEVVRGLGYMKLQTAELQSTHDGGNAAISAKPMPTEWDEAAGPAESSTDSGAEFSSEPEFAY